MPFYSQLLQASPLQQGDVLENVPFAYFSVDNSVVLHLDINESNVDLTSNLTGKRAIAATVESSWGIVLSQTCDVQPDHKGYARKPVLVARVQPIKDIVSDFKDANIKQSIDSVNALKNPGKSPSIFYLPGIQLDILEFPRSGVNLSDIQRFRREDLPSLTSLLRLRLTDAALQALQERCAYFFGRYGSPDDMFFSSEEWEEVQRREAERLRTSSET